MTDRRLVRGLVASALATATLLAGCSSSTGDGTNNGKATGSTTNGGTTSAGQGSGSASATPDAAQTVAEAKRLAASYDYDGALKALTGATGADADAARTAITAAKAKAVVWADDKTIPHVFYHTLAVDPKRAFAAGSEGVGFSQYMATVDEFKAQIAQMYQRGYVLVHPQRIAAKNAQGVMTYQKILLPPGKKPFVLSLDDISYYEYMTGKGFADKLVVEKDGRVTNVYTDAAGKTTQGAYDSIPLLDDFVREHPDFSYRGDKGTVALTGYNGVLGYRTSVHEYKDTPATRSEQAKARVVADAIKKNGWRFASHSWGHINMTRASLGFIKADSQRWDAEVKPIVGATDMLVYPFGADVSDLRPYSQANPKFAYLHDTEKFDYFFGVDGTSLHWQQLTPQSLRQARVNIDGLNMQRALDGKSSALPNFFDVRSTVDKGRPLPVPSIGGPRAGG